MWPHDDPAQPDAPQEKQDQTTETSSTTTTVAEPTQAPADPWESWPSKGYDGPQPWDLQALGLHHDARDLADRNDGAADTISPVVCREGLEMLTSGSRGVNVVVLAKALGRLGYPNTISTGSIDNAFGVVDPSVLGAAQAFRRDYGVAEDPSQFPRDPRNAVENHIGPITQEAILRADER